MLRITRIILLLQLAHCFANEIEALASTVLKLGSPSVSVRIKWRRRCYKNLDRSYD